MYEYCTTNSAGNFIFFFLIFSLLLNFPRENGTIFTTWSIHEYSKYNKTTGKEACIMRDYIISCCSTADLTEEHFKARDISYICFHFELDGREYADDLGKSIPFDKFYAAMAAGADTKTSQVNAEEFEEYFEPFLKAGKDILHVTLSSGLRFHPVYRNHHQILQASQAFRLPPVKYMASGCSEFPLDPLQYGRFHVLQPG